MENLQPISISHFCFAIQSRDVIKTISKYDFYSWILPRRCRTPRSPTFPVVGARTHSDSVPPSPYCAARVASRASHVEDRTAVPHIVATRSAQQWSPRKGSSGSCYVAIDITPQVAHEGYGAPDHTQLTSIIRASQVSGPIDDVQLTIHLDDLETRLCV